MAHDLDTGDVVLKGDNAFDSPGQATVQNGDRKGGTALVAVSVVMALSGALWARFTNGRRVQSIVPIGLEKRVFEDVNVLAMRCNAPHKDEGCRKAATA